MRGLEPCSTHEKNKIQNPITICATEKPDEEVGNDSVVTITLIMKFEDA
jgi:acyl carrier protein